MTLQGRSANQLLLLIYFILAVYLLLMFPHGGSANELTRWATTVSLVEKHSFEISWTEPLIGPVIDTAKIDKQIYSNKAPGPALLATPVYAITRLFIGAPSTDNIRTSWFVMRLLIGSAPLLVLGFWLSRRQTDAFSLSALLFATPLFLYSLLLFSHALVAVLIYFAFRFLFDETKPRWKQCLTAGILSGLAVTSEFPAIVAVATFAIGLAFMKGRDRVRRLLFFVAGGLPFAVALMAYNYSLFGSPFALSYMHESFAEWAEVANRGVLGISYPSPSNAFLLLFSPSRGLFFYAPILLLGAVSIGAAANRKSLRQHVRLGAIVASFLIFCGHGAAHGGWASGPRYLVVLIPLLLDPFFTKEIQIKSSLLYGSLLCLSLLLSTLPALTFPFAPPEFSWPHNTFWGKFLFAEQWVSPTLPTLFGAPPNLWTLVPVAGLLVAVILIVGWNSLEQTPFFFGSVAGLLLVGAYLFLPGWDNAENAFRRASIAERFFRPADRMAAFEEEAKKRSDWRMLARINAFTWTIADARAFAPNDFPYVDTRELGQSPTAQLKTATALGNEGRKVEAEKMLQDGKNRYPFGRCEFSTNLAVIYYVAGQKDAALQELEGIKSLVDRSARAECMRSLYLLGSLYKEMGRPDDARNVFQQFLTVSEGSTSQELQGYRRQLGVK